MLTSILKWICEFISDALDMFLMAFLDALDFSAGKVITTFPTLPTVYTYLQYIAVGLLVLIAMVGFITFFTADVGKFSENPWKILLKSALAGLLIYAGGYILSELIDVAKLSFDAFKSLDASNQGQTGFKALFSPENWGTLLKNDLSATVHPSSGALCVLSLVSILALGWNIIKLIVEVAERYLMVMVLLFTSPLAYPTMATKRTEGIFRRWISMFASSLILMSMSVIFLKIVMSGLNNISSVQDTTHFLMNIIFVLAMCKIAQRVDSYMQTLGMSAAITGGNLLDDIVAVGKSLRGMASGARRMINGEGVLGKAFGMTVPGMALNAARAATNTVAAGGTMAEAASAAGAGVLKGMPGGRVAAASEGAKTGRKMADELGKTGDERKDMARQEAAKAFKEGSKYVAAESLHGSEQQRAKADMEKQQQEVQARQSKPQADGAPYPDKNELDGKKKISDSTAKTNFDTYGAVEAIPEEKHKQLEKDRNDAIDNAVNAGGMTEAEGTTEKEKPIPDHYSPLQLKATQPVGNDEVAFEAGDSFAAAGGYVGENEDGNTVLMSKNADAVGAALRDGYDGYIDDNDYKTNMASNDAGFENYLKEERASRRNDYAQLAQTRDAVLSNPESTQEEKAAAITNYEAGTAKLENECRTNANSKWEAAKAQSATYSQSEKVSDAAQQIYADTARSNPAAATAALFNKNEERSFPDKLGGALIDGAFQGAIAGAGKDYHDVKVVANPRNNGSIIQFKGNNDQTYYVVEKSAANSSMFGKAKTTSFDLTNGITVVTNAPTTGKNVPKRKGNRK